MTRPNTTAHDNGGQGKMTVDAAVRQMPAGGTWGIRNARLPAALVVGDAPRPAGEDGFVLADLVIAGDTVGAVTALLPSGIPAVDIGGGQVWPTFAELHTHLDKGHISPRARNADGTVYGAVEAVRRDRLANWTAEDVERRFDFSLRCAHAHGTSAIRTHIDSYHPQAPVSWPVFTRMRAEWQGRVELQGVALTLMDDYETELGRGLADLVADAGGILGGVTRFSAGDQSPERYAAALDRLFRLAGERGLDVDLHVDETADLTPNTLREVALAASRAKFNGRVVCGHCCSLALRPEQEAQDTIALVKDAGLCVVTLPLINLHLQGRQTAATPRWRGVTLVRELAAAGVPVAASSDNCRDPFYAYGDLDALEVFRETVRICHLDFDAARWTDLVTRAPADIMRLGAQGRIAAGHAADLIIFKARSMEELLARPQSDRIVLRNGRLSEAVLPDYRELDGHVAGRGPNHQQ
jgi:cytosine/creatinine deaminase